MRLILLTSLLSTSLTFCNSTDTSVATSDKVSMTEASNKFLDTTLSNQLNQLLASADGGFTSLKGQETKLETGETVYESLTTLDATSKNVIGMAQGRPYYKANILNKVNEDQARSAVKQWKSKLQSIIGLSTHDTPFRSNDGKALRDGYIFNRSNHYLKVYWISYENTPNDYDVVLVIV